MINLPNRKKLRYKGFDYSSYATYFITICTDKRRFIFGDVVDGVMQLSSFGQIVDIEFKNFHTFHDNTQIVNYVIMPNHVHILLSLISNDLEYLAKEEAPQLNNNSIPKIIQRFKAGITRTINAENNYTPKKIIWQKSYHDRIIRNEKEFEIFHNYIDINPTKWSEDCHNPTNIDYKKWEP